MKIESKCITCFTLFRHYASRSSGKYCSNECSAKGRKLDTFIKIESGANVDIKPLKRWLQETQNNCCALCSIAPFWNGKPLTLQLDHVDGDSDNNHFTNVRLLCPNCHTQTDTFGSKGRGSRYKKLTKRNKYLQEYKLV